MRKSRSEFWGRMKSEKRYMVVFRKWKKLVQHLLNADKKPQGFYCPICGSDLVKSITKDSDCDVKTKCRKCGRDIIIQKKGAEFILFPDRRKKLRA